MTSEPIINTLDDAQFWISVMHRRTVSDAKRIADLYGQLLAVKDLPVLGWWVRRAIRKGNW